MKIILFISVLYSSCPSEYYPSDSYEVGFVYKSYKQERVCETKSSIHTSTCDTSSTCKSEIPPIRSSSSESCSIGSCEYELNICQNNIFNIIKCLFKKAKEKKIFIITKNVFELLKSVDDLIKNEKNRRIQQKSHHKIKKASNKLENKIICYIKKECI
ncbi:hypothetical protein TCON_1380 [Astathelohania contejeani]|uniref:Uncharacterized protein n=1 Tax=Astathelohania contejeani TaxID=164912 RepID=A0ABQ7HZ59_9MICR|nr:hypothetical protein TCON_1380 [Thelohania contejeani]